MYVPLRGQILTILCQPKMPSVNTRQFGCVKCNFVLSSSFLIKTSVELLYVVGLFALSTRSRFGALSYRARLNVAIGLFRSAARALFCCSLFCGISHCNPLPPLSITYISVLRNCISLMRLRNYSLCHCDGFIQNTLYFSSKIRQKF